MNITGALQQGPNTTQIAVANLQTTRLVGKALGAVESITFATYPG
jgi:hypothetical protein